MINQINFEKLNAVIRLFTVYVEQGSQKPDAISQCEQKLGNGYYRELGLVKEIFSEESSSSQNSSKLNWSFFQSLKSDVAESGGDSDKALIEVSKLIKLTSTGFKACTRFYKAIYTYPMIIIVIAMLVYAQYKFFVFDSMTSAFNQDIPELSRIVFSDITTVVMLILVVIAIAFFIISMLNLKREFALFKPNHSWFSRTLFCGNDQSYLLFLLYFKTMLNCGAEAQQALQKSKQYAGISNSIKLWGYASKQDVLNALSSESNDVVSSEAGFQLNTAVNEMEEKLIAKQEKILAFFQIMIFVFIGTMIIAMYLPIFKLGSIFS